MKFIIAAALLLGSADFSYADPPGRVIVGVTVTMKAESIDVFSTGSVSTVTQSASAFGISVSPPDRPVILSNRLDYPSLRNVGKGRGGYEKVGRVRLPSRVISGYLMRSTTDPPIEFSSGTLAAFQASRHFFLCTDLKEMHNPPFEGWLISPTNVSCAIVDPMSMSAIEHYPGPFEGRTKYFGLPLDPRLVQLEAERPPDYICQDDQGYGITWVSYNKSIGEKELKPLCDREAQDPPDRVTDEERAAMLKNKDVFFFSFGYD